MCNVQYLKTPGLLECISQLETVGSEVYLYDVYGTLGHVVDPHVAVENLGERVFVWAYVCYLSVKPSVSYFSSGLEVDQGSDRRIGQIPPMHISCQ